MVSVAVSHIVLGTRSTREAERFYSPILAMLGWRRRLGDASSQKLLWQPPAAARPLFGVMKPFDGAAHQVGNGAMTAFNAPDRETVDAVYDLAVALGGTCEGSPGLRPHYHPNYYGAYFRDLDGNKLCVACHTAEAKAHDMVKLSEADMLENALAWIAAWNRRDLPAVLAGFDPDATFRSPVAEKVTGVAEIAGTRALSDYWEKALGQIGAVQFTLLDVLCDQTRQTMAVLYIAQVGGTTSRACEIFRFKNGRKVSGEALYGCWL